MSTINNTVPPIYDADMIEPFLKPFIESREEADKEYAKYGNNMKNYMKRKIEEIQRELSDLDID